MNCANDPERSDPLNLSEMKIVTPSPQPPSVSGRGTAFTLVELLMVISVIGILASFTVGLARVASTRMKESRVRAELTQLVTAIDNYHATLGFYPPDNRDPNQKTVNSVTNVLYYELVGTTLTNRDKSFVTKNGAEQIDVNTVSAYFRTRGFANSGRDPKEVKSFLSPREKQIGQISDVPDVDVLVVPVEWALNKGFDPPLKALPAKFLKLNPWRYDASSTNRHNMKGFDLWAEYVVGKELKVIGNWKD